MTEESATALARCMFPMHWRVSRYCSFFHWFGGIKAVVKSFSASLMRLTYPHVYRTLPNSIVTSDIGLWGVSYIVIEKSAFIDDMSFIVSLQSSLKSFGWSESDRIGTRDSICVRNVTATYQAWTDAMFWKPLRSYMKVIVTLYSNGQHPDIALEAATRLSVVLSDMVLL